MSHIRVKLENKNDDVTDATSGTNRMDRTPLLKSEPRECDYTQTTTMVIGLQNMERETVVDPRVKLEPLSSTTNNSGNVDIMADIKLREVKLEPVDTTNNSQNPYSATDAKLKGVKLEPVYKTKLW